MASIDFVSISKSLSEGKTTEVAEKLKNETLAKEFQASNPFLYLILRLKIFKHRKSPTSGIELIDLYESSNNGQNASSTEKFYINAFKCYFLIERGLVEYVKPLLEDLLSYNQIDQNVIGEIDIKPKMFIALISGKYHKELGNFDKTIKILEQITEDVDSPINNHLIIDIYEEAIRVNFHQGNHSKTDELVDKLKKIIMSLDSQFLKAEGLNVIIELYYDIVDMDSALSCLEEYEKIIQELHSYELLYHYFCNSGKKHRYLGEIELSIEEFKHSLKIANNMNSEYYVGAAFNNIGTMYNKLGAIDSSLDVLFKSLQIYEKIGNPRHIGTAYNNIAINYSLKGEFDKSLEFLLKYLEIVEKQGHEKDKAIAYVNIGQIYHMKGENLKAEKYYQKTLEIDMRHENKLDIAETIYNILTLKIEMDELSEAEKYNSLLQDLNNRTDNVLIKLRTKLANMLLLKTSSRSINKAKAQEILLEIVEEEPIEFELYASALIHLSDLLYLELKQSGEQDVLEEIKHYIDILTKYATEQQSYLFLAESYVIQSKIAQLELDLGSAKELLQKAEEVIHNRGMDKMAMKISSYYDDLLDVKSIMENLLDKNTTLKERLDYIELQEVFMNLIDTKEANLSTQTEDPSMFIILQRASTSIYSISFKDDETINEELIAGLLSALFTLSDEVFNTRASIQRIKHEDYTIIMKPTGENLIFCYVFKGQSYNAIKKLERLVTTITDSKTIWKALLREVSHLTMSEKQGMDLIVRSILLGV